MPWEVGPLQIGYARISTDDQNLALQRDTLTAAGYEKIYEAQTQRSC